MRKLLVSALTAVFALAPACTTVEPTEISFKYSATVTGHVRYAVSLSPAEGFDVKISTVDNIGESTAVFHATTDSEGAFTMEVPCKGPNGFSSVKVWVDKFVHDGKMYDSSSRSITLKAGVTSSDLILTLDSGISVE